MKRREFIKSSAYGLSSIALGGSELLGFGASALAQTNNTDPFARDFITPPLDTGLRDGNQVRFKLEMRKGESNFVANYTTPTLGINSDYLAPVLRAKKGDHVSFEVSNQLDEVTTLHWHGFVLPARMDGGPHQVIEPGQTWKPEFDLVQSASTFWFHAHTHERTGSQVYHGLAGMFIVDDDVSLNAGLPIDYGVDDFPVVIQDRAFYRDGSLRYLGSMPDRMRGMLGNVLLVNGVVTPTLTAERPLTRLRLLNGSNARIYNLAFHDARPFTLIASDGGFLANPMSVNSVSLAPGERAEILLDMSDGREAILRNQPEKQASRGGMMGMMNMMGGGAEQAFSIMKILPPKNLGDTLVSIPQKITTLPDWRNVELANTRQFQLEMAMGPRMMMGGNAFSINGASMDMNIINTRVRRNTFELWEISNNSMLVHPFHIHDTQFRVIARSSGRKISATEQGLKDTVQVFPQERVRLLVPFADHDDTERPFMYHCHILEHEDRGMMGQFTVEA